WGRGGGGVGAVQWGIIEAGGRATYYFRGTAVDGCTAAEHQAQQGQVVIDAALYGAVREWVTAVPLANFYLLQTANHPAPTPAPAPQAITLPPFDLAFMSRFFPPDLIQQSLSGEFRWVINLFIGLPDIHTTTQLETFIHTVFELQDHYGGLLSRVDFGDKGANLLMFWGAPVTHENDIERALSFILDLQARSSTRFRAGITTRIAHAGFNGSPLREEYTCHGRGVNLAARFMMTAAHGEIWVDAEIAQRARPHFDIPFVADMPFKGFAQPQPVHALLGRKETAERFFAGEFIGRQQELAELCQFVQPLQNGRFAGLLVLWGEAGMGKSRLVHTLLEQIPADNSVFICQTDQILRQSFNPFRYWLRHYFAQSASHSDTRNRQNFEHKLDALIAATTDAGLAQELQRTRSFLGALIDLHWPDSLYAQLDPRGRFDNTLIALATLLQAECRQQPVLLVLEDAHWLDEESQQFLRQLLLTVTAVPATTYPLAIIITARPDPVAAHFTPDPTWAELRLAQLSTADLNHLATTLLGSAAAPALQALLLARADGNPFFAEQIIHYLQEQQLLHQTAAGWNITDSQTDPLPPDVQTLLIARIDRLTGIVKETVQHAAILGREFEVRLLSLMLQSAETLPHSLAEAERAAIWSALDQLRYLFKHALLRDAVYRMQLRARRQALHQLALTALESLYAADLSAHYKELAYHAERGRLSDKARHYLQKAGDAAQEAYENNQAVAYYTRALALTPPEDVATRYRLLLSREQVLHSQGNRTEQAADLAALQELVSPLQDKRRQAEVVLRQSRYAEQIGDYPAQIAAAQTGVHFAQEIGPA
ncbi:MAG: AAA family ATPase, partial [Anaerolineales bacterium]|nr:AAA family ATPase [Anaerolineales bacterium]